MCVLKKYKKIIFYNNNSNKAENQNSVFVLLIDNLDDLYINKDKDEESVMTGDILGAKGIDIYIFEGENITDIVSKYYMLSGGGCNIPQWGLGTTYRAHANYTDKDIMEFS